LYLKPDLLAFHIIDFTRLKSKTKQMTVQHIRRHSNICQTFDCICNQYLM